MNIQAILQSVGIWFLLIPIAILNGTVRNYLYQPWTGELAAHWISSIILSGLIFLITYIFLKNTKAVFSKKDLIMVGVLWVLLTMIFEFGFGHFIMGHPWEKLLADYNIFKGRVWSLVLLADLIAPYLVGIKILK